MRRIKKHLSFLFVLFSIVSIKAQTIHFTNGNIYKENKFIQQDYWVKDGRITFIEIPADALINISGKYVIPPFSEAHNHSIDQDWQLDQRIKSYLSKGIFYYKNPNNMPTLTKAIAHKINHPKSLDVSFANGGLTGTDGHPITLYESIWDQGLRYMFSSKTKEFLNGEAFHTINTAQELNEKWETILAASPDFIKIYILYSEEYELRKDNPEYKGKKGLNPTLVPLIVKKAHQKGLRVSAHIETAYDFEVAVMAGVDEINHLPAYMRTEKGFDYVIKKKIAKLAKNIVLIPTYSLINSEFNKIDSLQKIEVEKIQRKNLAVLKKQNCTFAIGCDSYFSTSHTEFFYLAGLEIFSNNELLKMYTTNSALTIFPNRKIGKMEEGYQADFLILNNNPIVNLKAILEIDKAYKNAKIISN